jgi:transposase-like protein
MTEGMTVVYHGVCTFRSRNGAYQSQILPRYGRFEPAAEDLVRETFPAGVSTRRVGEVLDPILDGPVSAQTVSRMTKILDAAVRAFLVKGAFYRHRP